MSTRTIRSAGIIAAGDGTRLRRDGWDVPKALVTVNGTALIEHVIDNFLGNGIESVSIIVNEHSREVVDWVRSRYPEYDIQFTVKTTASSLESFFEVNSAMAQGAALISTVDAWCPPGAFSRFVDAARELPADSTVLAVSRFVDDERPLWVKADADGRVTEIGAESGDTVTAGMYLIPPHVRKLGPVAGLQRLREFLAWLPRHGETVYCVELPMVVDVDRGGDVALAARLATHLV